MAYPLRRYDGIYARRRGYDHPSHRRPDPHACTVGVRFRGLPEWRPCVSRVGRLLLLDDERRRELGGVRVFVAGVNLELGVQAAAEAALGEHAFDGMLDEQLGLAGAALGDCLLFLAAFPAGVGHERLVRFLVAGEDDPVNAVADFLPAPIGIQFLEENQPLFMAIIFF